jgi:hypothetical protein
MTVPTTQTTFSPDYVRRVDRLVTAITACGARFTLLSEHDEIGGVASYNATDELLYDILVIPEDQTPEAGFYLFRFVDGDPTMTPSFELQTNDLDAIIAAMRSKHLLAKA